MCHLFRNRYRDINCWALHLSAAEAGADDVSDFGGGFEEEHVVDALFRFGINGIGLPPSGSVGQGAPPCPLTRSLA